MRAIFFALDWAANPAYFILGAIVLWYVYRVLQSNSEISSTYFELERDLARTRRANALTVIIITLEVAVLLFGVQLRAVPFLETERDMDTIAVAQANSTQDVRFDTPTPVPVGDTGLSLEVGTPLGDNPDIIVLTPTPTSTPVGTIIPNAPPIEGCESPQARLQVPANGQRVFAPLVIRGTAFTDDFIEAKLEISGPSTLGVPSVISNINAPVREVSDFSQFLPAPYESGEYQFRLMVFDISRNLVASCQVTIYISEPPMVATPTPSRG